MYFTQGRSADKYPGDPMKVYRGSKEEGDNRPASEQRQGRVARRARDPGDPGRRSAMSAARSCFNVAAWAHARGVVPTSQPIPRERGRPGVSPEQSRQVPASGGTNACLCRWHYWQTVNLVSVSAASRKRRAGRHLPCATRTAADSDALPCAGLRLLGCSPARQGHRQHNGRQPSTRAPPTGPGWSEHFYLLLENVSGDWDAEAGRWKPPKQQLATNTWRRAIKDEARRALEESVRSLGATARAIQAVARVRTDFNDSDLRPPQKAEAAERKTRGGKRK